MKSVIGCGDGEVGRTEPHRGTGEYQNASEAVRDALRVLQQRRREDALKLKALRMQIKAGVEALDRGEFDDIAEADLDAYLEDLTTAPRKRAR